MDKIFTAQRIRGIAFGSVPFQRPHQQAFQGAIVFEIGIDGFEQDLKGCVVIVCLTEENPVVRGNRRVDFLFIVYLDNIAMQQRQKSLALRHRVINLFAANIRAHAVGADDKDKRVGSINPGLDLLPPIRCFGNIFKVCPDFFLLPFEGIKEFVHEVIVFARVGNENI
jgi:hypothetical protein